MKSLLCLTDFSASADNAMRYTHELAQRMNSRMTLFHSKVIPVCPALVSCGGEAEEGSLDGTLQERLVQEKLQANLDQLEHLEWGLPVRYAGKVKEGTLRENISAVVKEETADLAVVGYAGEKNLRKILQNSTAAKVIEHAFCPVLIVPRQTVFRPLRTIVFATDLRGEPASGMDMVLKTAQVFEAKILFLHVQTDDNEGTSPVTEERLNQIYQQLPYKNVSFHIQKHQQVEEGISKFVRQKKADMLVMGFHPKTAWRHLFGGEPAAETMPFPPLPVLVFPYER
jgi:nucleotide-binding universal stress UspA family protein